MTSTLTTTATPPVHDMDRTDLHSKERLERKSLVLWRRPLMTIWYSILEACELVLTFGVRLLNKYVISILLIWAIVFYLPGPHASHMRKCHDKLGFALYWLGLGILSSVGFGTGVHTFLLYLGPHIIGVTLAAYECQTLDFPTPPYPDEKICPQEPYLKSPNLCVWDILAKVRQEALLWGIGTALGELPPYFMARTARLSGQESEDIEELEQLRANRLEGRLCPLDRAKLLMEQVLQRVGFMGILACASVPNPLFDLAGLTCGHFLVPFWKFFMATLIGKALIKATLQQLTIIVAFSDNLVNSVIDCFGQVPFVGSSLQSHIKELFAATKKRMHNAGQDDSSSSLGLVVHAFQLCSFLMIVWFAISTIQSLAQRHFQRLQEEQRKTLMVNAEPNEESSSESDSVQIEKSGGNDDDMSASTEKCE